MARTLHMQLTPSRRSKRLVENGYYAIPPGDPNSEDDDNSSVHSNTSSLYSERVVQYRESPSIGVRRRRHRRLADSPQLASVSTNTAEQNTVVQSWRFAKKKRVRTSTSSTYRHIRDPPDPITSQSAAELTTVGDSNDATLLHTSFTNLSAGDQGDAFVDPSSYHQSPSRHTPTEISFHRSDTSKLAAPAPSVALSLHRFLFSFISSLVYGVSKVVYLTALTVYSLEVRSLAWRIGILPLKILKYLFITALILVTAHFVALHGEEYVVMTQQALTHGWGTVRSFQWKKPVTVPTIPLPNNKQTDALLHNQNLEATITEMEVGFVMKLAEMKESLESLQTSFEKFQHQLQDLDVAKTATDSKIASLQSYLKEQYKTYDTVQQDLTNLRTTFRTSSQSFATKREVEDLGATLTAQHARLNDLIVNMMEKYDGQLSNESLIRELVTIQVIDTLLQQIKTSNEETSRVQTALLSWLTDHGYVTKEELNLQIKTLQGLYVTKLERFRQDARRHASTITLEKIVERPVTGSLQGPELETEVRRWIKDALDLHSADRVGLADHALESAGGAVTSTRCTESYDKKTALLSVFGIPFYYNINTPRSIIQPGSLPGECWSFKGVEGYVVIALSGSVRPSSFTLEHIPKELSLAGHIDSAPKDFIVLGLGDASDETGIILGKFRYDREGPPIQQFMKETITEEYFTHIELRIRSNWGNSVYTCVYRFRVHGERANP